MYDGTNTSGNEIAERWKYSDRWILLKESDDRSFGVGYFEQDEIIAYSIMIG